MFSFAEWGNFAFDIAWQYFNAIFHFEPGFDKTTYQTLDLPLPYTVGYNKNPIFLEYRKSPP